MNLLRTFGIAACTLLTGLSSLASAQATRTWISGVGDDVNPCSRTAPCKTFQGAISKTAAGGEIDALDPGGFGAVTITKSITLDGGGTLASILVSGTNGITVNAGANDTVRIKNLAINGISGSVAPGLNGIRMLNGKSLQLEGVTIHDFSANCVDLSPTVSATISLSMRNVSLSNCTGAGVAVNTSTATVSGVLDQISVVKSGVGVNAIRGAKLTVSRSSLTANAYGVYATNSTIVNIIDSTLSYNGKAAETYFGTINITGNTIVGNDVGISIPAGSIMSSGNNRFFANGSDGTPTSTVTLH